MSYTVKQLIEGHSNPVTVKLNEPVKGCLNTMIENNFSQLPVIDGSEKLMGMVTSESILWALSNFGGANDNLKVSDVYVKQNRKFCFSPEDELWDLLECLRNYCAALIVYRDGRLICIVTSYDLAKYFSQRAQDFMLAEDFETTIKNYIRNAIPDDNSETALASEIEKITEPMKDKFKEALRVYLKNYPELKDNKKLNSDWVEDAFSCMQKKRNTREFDELTLNDYITMLRNILEEWHNPQLFGMDSKSIEKFLAPVLKIRNKIAHFRGEISQQEKRELKYGLDWFERHPINKRTLEEVVVPDLNDLKVTLPDEASVPEDSRYVPLAQWLQSQPIERERVPLTFKEIESIINNTLPSSARQHPSWWANDPSDNPQSQWVEAGWRVAIIKINEERVTFARMKDREKTYIEFFNALLSELSAASDIPWKMPSPDGQGWVHVFYFPEGKKQIPLAYSFAHGGRLRIELYIAVGNQAKNKQIYDGLYFHKNEIEDKVGEQLTWERMDEKDASRVALYRKGAITDRQEQLVQLRAWAVNAMIRFYNAIARHASDEINKAG